MFLSDKDVRKGAVVSRGGGGGGSGGGGGKKPTGGGSSATKDDDLYENLVEKARIDRETRKITREQSVFAIKIQAWWRGRKTIINVVVTLRNEVDKKMADIEKLAAVLLATSKVIFIPPLPICLELAKKLTAFGYHGNEDAQRISMFCRCILLPSLREMDPVKNIATVLFSPLTDKCCFLASRICQFIIFASSSPFVKKGAKKNVATVGSIEESTVSSVLLPCLRLLVGGGAPYRLQYSTQLADAFAGIRVTLLWKRQLFRRFRALFTMRTDAAVTAIPDGDFHVTTANVIKRPARGCAGDVTLSMCMFLVAAEYGNPATAPGISDRLADFCREIMTVPLLTAVCSNDGMAMFVHWKLFKSVLEYLHRPQLALPPSSHEVFLSGQWLAGNVASFAPYLHILATPSTPSTPLSDPNSKEVIHADIEVDNDGTLTDETLERYLLVCVSLLRRFEIPGALQGRGGVVWTRNGVSLNAAGVPAALHEQVLSLMDASFSKSLYVRVLLPLRDDLRVSPLALAEDRREVHEALSSSGLQIARATIEHQTEASTYFTSKWAQKMMKSVGKSLGVSSGYSSAKSTGATSPTGTSSGRGSSSAAALHGSDSSSLLINEVSGSSSDSVILPPTDFEENSRLIAALGGLWSLVLPHAAAASSESRAWKALSSLAFGTHAVSRLWVAALRQSAPYANANNITKGVGSSNTFYSAKTSSSVTPAPPHGRKSSSSGGSMTSGFLSMLGLGSSGSASNASSSSGGGGGSNRIPSATTTATTGCLERYAECEFNVSQDLAPDCMTQGQVVQSILVALTAILRMILSATDDSEIYDGGKPLPLVQVLRLVRTLKMILFRSIQHDPSILVEPTPSSATEPIDLHHLGTSTASISSDRLYRYGAIRSISAVLTDLYTRWARRPFSASTLWEIEQTDTSLIKTQLRTHTPFAIALLRVMPWSIDFYERLKLFREVVDGERVSIQGVLHDSNDPTRSKGVMVRVRRSHILYDGMAALDKVGADIKDRVVVRYLNNFGEEEAGIDIGGLFKDFLTDLSARIFDISYGLFALTSNNLLYPNPAAAVLYPGHGELEALYSFLGRVLGKALFENITVQPQFAHFFLAFMHGRYNFMNLVNDLATLDQELYKNLMFLKSYDGDIADLSLTFSISDEAMGIQREIDLIPGGSKIVVTSKNRHRYINAVAKHYLYDRLKRQARAFFGGMYQVIQPDLLSIFCAPELQVLISGANVGISIDDLRRNTRYAGGYTMVDRHIAKFWAILEEMSAEDRCLLVKFVTSCERPPSLGFSALQPPFTIQRVDCNDDQRLPTASTCFNALKLPTYSTQDIMKERLLTSIRSGAGFDLS